MSSTFDVMGSVSKRELNQNTAAVLQRVNAHEDVVVTERGKPMWRISGFVEESTALDRLAREGRYVPAETEPAPWPGDVTGPRYKGTEIDELLADMRGDH